jgi:N-hydroxyarylamine O-acetyltransferase
LTLTAPLLVDTAAEQQTPHERFRVLPSGHERVLEAHAGGLWRPLYRFGLHEQLLPDFEVTNWYLSNHPESQFVTNLMAARAGGDARYTLRNNELVVHHRDGRRERRLLTTPEEIVRALRTPFGIRFPDSPDLRAALARIIARAA